jgi:fibronectin-binding autotransporter adhesin
LNLSVRSEVHLAASNQISDSALVTLFDGTVFRMLNFSDHIGGLAAPSNGSIVENESGSVGSATLTLGDNTTNQYAFKGTIRDGDSRGIDGVLSLAKVGTNTQILKWENTYTGSTTVSAGKLVLEEIGSINSTSDLTIAGGALVANSSTAIARTVNVTGGTLSGTGRVAAATIVTGGRVSPGQGTGDVGTLRLGAMSMTAASSLDFDLGALSDLIQMSGALTLDGTLNVNWMSAAAAVAAGGADEKYVLISGFTSLTNNGLSLGLMPANLAGYSIGIDNINHTVFLAATAVPEPGTFGISMLIAGGLALSRRRRCV